VWIFGKILQILQIWGHFGLILNPNFCSFKNFEKLKFVSKDLKSVEETSLKRLSARYFVCKRTKINLQHCFHYGSYGNPVQISAKDIGTGN